MRKTFGQSKVKVSKLAGDASNDGKATAGDALNDAQELIEAIRAWSFLRPISASILLTAGTATYATPDGMYYASKVYWKNPDGTLGGFLDPADDDEFLKYYLGQTSGEPSRYRMLGFSSVNHQTKIQIGVAPSSAHIARNGQHLYLEQVNALTPLTEDSQYSDLPGEFSKALEYFAAALQCQSQGDNEQAASLMATHKMFINPLIANDVKRYGKQFPLVPTKGAAPNAWRGRSRRGYR